MEAHKYVDQWSLSLTLLLHRSHHGSDVYMESVYTECTALRLIPAKMKQKTCEAKTGWRLVVYSSKKKERVCSVHMTKELAKTIQEAVL